MPHTISKYDNVKVWRPNGTPYSEAELDFKDWPSVAGAFGKVVEDAVHNFYDEFGRFPDSRRTVVEVLGGYSSVSAAVYELPQE